ncbi:hypothetical protein [uncultured Fusobacterium sp.]|uniref:hypothetical protein n=1 Tax=uncultured Fusobacterium sp. TaxID=159267 RepID=UPI0027DB7333|nr:hypothetical protein [uncultured Fusobacterium sp.]
MNRKRDSIIFFSINIVLFIVFRILSYYDTKVFIPLSWRDFRIFLYITFFIAMVWTIIEYAQKISGDLMKSSWGIRLAFIIVALLLIYLYKSTGRI